MASKTSSASKAKSPEVTKYQKFEVRTIARKDINPAPYNPRVIGDENGRALKRNLRSVGLLAPLVWNKRTGHLVSGHQRLQRLDELEGYPKRKDEYLLSVAVVDLDVKTEKEQNLFFNNLSAQGDWDLDALASLLSEVDYKSAGFTERDMAVLDIDVDGFGFSEKEKETAADVAIQSVQGSMVAAKGRDHSDEAQSGEENEPGDEEAEALRKEDVRRRRKEMKAGWDEEGDVDYTLTIVYESATAKREFLEELRIDPSIDMVRADRFTLIMTQQYTKN